MDKLKDILSKDLETLNLESLKAKLRPLEIKYVAIYVYNELGEMLLGQRKDNETYTCIAGGIESYEDPKTAAIREAFEEAKLNIDVARLQEYKTKPVPSGEGLIKIYSYHIPESEVLDLSTNLDPDDEVYMWTWHKKLGGINSPHAKCYQEFIATMNLKKALTNISEDVTNSTRMINTTDELVESTIACPTWQKRIQEKTSELAQGSLPVHINISDRMEGTLTLQFVDHNMFTGTFKRIENGVADNILKFEQHTVANIVSTLLAKGVIAPVKLETPEAPQEIAQTILEPSKNTRLDSLTKLLDILSE